MTEYINRDVLIENLQKFASDNYSAIVNNIIMAMPKADVAPVVHRRWVQKKEWHLGRWVAWFECSECGEHDDNLDMYEMMPFCNLSNYCPGCGAKMEEHNESEN